jgi:hypothetical protein
MMETIQSSETSVLTRDTRRLITEDGILHFYLFSTGGFYMECKLFYTLMWQGKGRYRNIYQYVSCAVGN